MGSVLLEIEEQVAIVSLHRPLALNALTTELCKHLLEVFSELEKQRDVRAVILTGTGRAFCAGADIIEMHNLSTVEAFKFLSLIKDTFLAVENASCPVIAAVNGVAFGGGCELVLACDLRMAAENSQFGLPEVTLGIMPTGGATQRLPRLIGMPRAKELILTGKRVKAKDALQIGLINMVVPNDELMSKAKELAWSISDNSPLAVKMAKASLKSAWESNIHMGLKAEINCGVMLWNTKDQKEGMTAFMEKRKPRFVGD